MVRKGTSILYMVHQRYGLSQRQGCTDYESYYSILAILTAPTEWWVWLCRVVCPSQHRAGLFRKESLSDLSKSHWQYI